MKKLEWECVECKYRLRTDKEIREATLNGCPKCGSHMIGVV